MRILCILVLAGLLSAEQLSEWRVQGPGRDPVMRCEDLRSLTGYEFSVASAELIPAVQDTPQHCRVSGLVQPEVAFEVNLPASWNGRLYMFGNGGYAGESFDQAGRPAVRTRGLRNHFMTAATNTGHDARPEPGGTFAATPQKLLDYAFRAIHVTAETAKKLSSAYYGTGPSKSFFDACSTGGRQGLMSAQRFPADFDGILVGAPVLNFSGTMLSYTWMNQKIVSAPIREDQLKTLQARVMAVCDEKDGLKDGLIQDPRRCDFQPARDLPKCDNPSANCFSPSQIATLERMYSDVIAGGKRVFPGWPVGGEEGWVNWLVKDSPPSIAQGFLNSFFRDLTRLHLDWREIDLDRDPPKLEPIHKILDATDPNLTAFRDRGGKILMYFGWADQALNPRMGIEYYEQVQKQMGSGTTDFFRLYMIPGMYHCGGGPGPNQFDAFTPLVNWTEKGTAPEALRATNAHQSRPLCVYPQVARYSGTGSIDDAASFRCVTQ